MVARTRCISTFVRTVLALTLCLVTGSSIIGLCSAQAGPLILRDFRVQDTDTTPYLGRGYSLATNAFSSVCIKSAGLTEPSYDFTYHMQEVRRDDGKTLQTALNMLSQTAVNGIRVTIENNIDRAARVNKTSTNVLVNLRVFKYYASLNDAQASLSDNAMRLVERQDLPGFYSACGSYYIRGLTRVSEYISLFNLRTSQETDTSSLVVNLRTELASFMRSTMPPAITTGTTELSTDAAAARSDFTLTIDSRGYGLGKQANASLISTDLETFRSASKTAFISMNNPVVGIVNSAEAVSWTDNLTFQEKSTITGNDVLSGEEVPLHRKKYVLSQNAEFMQQIWKVARDKLDRYYKADLCRQYIKGKWYKRGRLETRHRSIALRNNRTESIDVPPVTLGMLDTIVARVANQYLRDYKAFLYKARKSATACINKILEPPEDLKFLPGTLTSTRSPEVLAGVQSQALQGRGIFLVPYGEHRLCRFVEERLSDRQSIQGIIEDHCMPVAIHALGRNPLGFTIWPYEDPKEASHARAITP